MIGGSQNPWPLRGISPRAASCTPHPGTREGLKFLLRSRCSPSGIPERLPTPLTPFLHSWETGHVSPLLPSLVLTNASSNASSNAKHNQKCSSHVGKWVSHISIFVVGWKEGLYSSDGLGPGLSNQMLRLFPSHCLLHLRPLPSMLSAIAIGGGLLVLGWTRRRA